MWQYFILHLFTLLLSSGLILICQHFQMDFPSSLFASRNRWESFCCCWLNIFCYCPQNIFCCCPQNIFLPPCCCCRCYCHLPRHRCLVNLMLETSAAERKYFSSWVIWIRIVKRIRQRLRSNHNISPENGWEWKWSNGKSKSDIFWCTVKSYKHVLPLALGDRLGLFIQTLNNAEKLFIQLKKELSPT